MPIHPDWLRPDWRIPGVGALMSTRAGGCGQGAFESLNLRHGIGDDPATVAANQALFAEAIGATPVWLGQVHGTRVARLTMESLLAPGALEPVEAEGADASVTSVPGVACTVQVADCLPVLFAAPQARAVGAAHAGWRGLAAGIVEATLAELCDLGRCGPEEVSAWLGACIGPRRFEVGEDVLRAFGVSPGEVASAQLAGGDVTEGQPVADAHDGDSLSRTRSCFQPYGPAKWLADLPQLARDRLHAAGVRDITGGSWCTVENSSRFFSYRRDRVTGRMAAAIWIRQRR